MADAISGTEAIRGWDDHVIGIDALCKRLNTDKAKGLRDADCKGLLT
jgi:hypothetical protein